MPPRSSPATGAPVAPPAGLADVVDRVERRLVALLDAERRRWAGLDADLADPLDRLSRAVLAGGKRLRPAFVFWGYLGAAEVGGPLPPVVDDAGAAFEMLHTFALVHDDVVDGSDTRRGQPALHTQYLAVHAGGGYRGDATRYGEGVAVLVGDLAHVYADVLSAGFGPRARSVWNELRVELNIGQYLDVLGTARGDTDPARADRIARYKSAKYTIERPLHLGAALAIESGSGEGSVPLTELHQAYTAYGVPLGEAFQLRDDVLGVFGDEAVTGKPVGDDLREGKPTPLLALAVARARPSQRALLALVGSAHLDHADIARCQEILVETGSLATIEDEIARRRDLALDALDRAPVAEAVRRPLREAAWYVTARDR